MATEGKIDVEDVDIRSGSLEAIATILTALGYEVSLDSFNGRKFITSASGGHRFHLFASDAMPGAHSWYIFLASFQIFGFNGSSANHWNSQSFGIVATLDERGMPELRLSVLRDELTVLGFTQYMGLWLQSLEKFSNTFSATGQRSSAGQDQIDSNASVIPDNVLSRIKTKAATEWPTDYQMQAYVIDEQSSAYRAIQAMSLPDIPAPIHQEIRASAAGQWVDDFNMQKYIIDEQIAAYRRLQK